jgi:hypothetical protein
VRGGARVASPLPQAGGAGGSLPVGACRARRGRKGIRAGTGLILEWARHGTEPSPRRGCHSNLQGCPTDRWAQGMRWSSPSSHRLRASRGGAGAEEERGSAGEAVRRGSSAARAGTGDGEGRRGRRACAASSGLSFAAPSPSQPGWARHPWPCAGPAGSRRVGRVRRRGAPANAAEQSGELESAASA